MIARYFLPLISAFTATSIASMAIAADSVTLKNGNTLSGSLTDSDASGILTLKYPDAKQPLKIRETSVESIVFDSSDRENSTLTHSMRLINGDHFPCTITELNDKIVSFKSDSVGTHTITRDKISQINFNTKANKPLYSGPGDDLSAWTSSTEDWKLNDGKLSVLKRSDIAKRIPNLTENYILEFKTTWDQATPHFRVCFSSDNSNADKTSDFYYIDLNSHGITMYRSMRGKYDTLTQVLGNDDIYGQKNLHVAIHIDRKNQKMALYLNGILTRTIKDQKTPPKGNYIVIKNLQQTGVLTQISDIKISSWGGKVPDDINSKADVLARHDLITDLSGNVMTGQIISIANTDGKTGLNFKPPFAKKDSFIPESAIDQLDFKTTDAEVPTLSIPIYQLNLSSGGVVSFSSSQMNNGKLNIEHPFLGKISLPKSSLASVIIIPDRPAGDKDEEQDDNDN